jgi:oxalate---CoA ligase
MGPVTSGAPAQRRLLARPGPRARENASGILGKLMDTLRQASIAHLLEKGEPGASALGAPEGVPPLSYRDLRALTHHTVGRLNGLGIGRGDRVAIVLSNGPEAAAAFVCMAAGATTAPLNPTYRADEYRFYLTDLGAKALVVEAGLDTPARRVAGELGIPLLELHPQRAKGAGTFTLEPLGSAPGPAVQSGFGDADDIALVLHTSGTTARPKIVPLLQRNVLASAGHIARSLALQPGDVCLNLMPLFHIHGLMAATLASLAAGAQVSCCPHFSALRFFAWFDEVRPTWYTAVPTMHQAILARASRHADACARSRLRLVRSSSARLPAPVMHELERVFGAPVIEAYGMTETAHQIASNPIPPGRREAGSVGSAAGPEVAILDDAGRILAPGETGEIAVSGPNVMPGYENNPEANSRAFSGAWFRTGDQGFLDQEGYLRITGRLKELINRGGEKISPSEVDDVLLHHPGVHQAVTFAVPHDVLGEEVAAAVVLNPGASTTDHELKAFAGEHLAHFKVPRRILFVPEIPKGSTGKVQRLGLAAALGLTAGR